MLTNLETEMDAVRSLLFRSSESSEDQKNPKTVNIFLGFFFMVNFVLGTGFLGTPYAFYYTGIIAGVASLIVISFVSWNCAIWELETMARAQVSPFCRRSSIHLATSECSTVKETGTTNFTITTSKLWVKTVLKQLLQLAIL